MVLVLACLGTIVNLVVPAVPAPSASAFTGADFDPGDIISDDNFFNGSALTADQVQLMLDRESLRTA